MAEPGTFQGELAAGWERFWRLPWRWKGSMLAVAAVILIGSIGALFDGGEEPVAAEPENTPTLGATPTETPTPTSTPTPTPEPTETPRPTSTPSPTPSPTATPTEEPQAHIPGLDARDVTLNLEDEGFECEGPRQLQTMVSYDCEDSADDGSWFITVSILAHDADEVRSVVGTVISVGTPPAALAGFLPFLATIPYDDAEPAAARDWVEAHAGEDAMTTFGGATYSLYGPAGARTLEIVAIGAE